MRNIVIYCQKTNSVGVRVIVDNLTKTLGASFNVSLSSTLPESKDDVYVIPYGLNQICSAITKGYNIPVALMVDYYSMAEMNVIKFFWHRWDFLKSKYAIGIVLRYFKYYIQEIYVFTRFHNFMFVSQTDINKVKKRFPNNNYYCVPNGVNIPANYEKKKCGEGLCFGFLSIWIESSFNDHKWFLDSYWPKIVEKYPNASIKICGRYASNEMIQYFNSVPNVEYIGEVDSLSTFFDMIDVYLAPVPKGVGILNKVLDSMSYKTLVVGISLAFTGFSYMKDSYVVCNTLQEYMDFIDDYEKNREKYDVLVNNAYNNIKKYNDWETNYSKFVNELQQKGLLK